MRNPFLRQLRGADRTSGSREQVPLSKKSLTPIWQRVMATSSSIRNKFFRLGIGASMLSSAACTPPVQSSHFDADTPSNPVDVSEITDAKDSGASDVALDSDIKISDADSKGDATTADTTDIEIEPTPPMAGEVPFPGPGNYPYPLTATGDGVLLNLTHLDT